MTFQRKQCFFCSRWVLNWIASRTNDGLSTISRCGIDATFKVYVMGICLFLLYQLIFKVAPENYAQLLILHAHIGGNDFVDKDYIC